MGFVSANQVMIGYTATSREDALHYLFEQAIELGFADDASAVEAAFIARENEAETGLVAGFAVPHAKSDAIHTPGVAVLKLVEPVEWPSFGMAELRWGTRRCCARAVRARRRGWNHSSASAFQGCRDVDGRRLPRQGAREHRSR